MPIPNSIPTVTAALRRFIEKRELEAIWGPHRPGRLQRDPNDGKTNRVRDPWRQPVDFRSPAAPAGRPISAEGATSFHLAANRLSKGGAAAEGGAAWHDNYVTAEPRERSNDPRVSDPSVQNPEAPKVGVAGVGATRAVAIRSNIDAVDLAARKRFWLAAERYERNPSEPHLTIHPDAGNEGWWNAAASCKDLPSKICAALERGRARHLEIVASRRAFVRGAKPIRVDQAIEAGVQVIDALNAIPGWDTTHPAVRQPQPRAGIVQERFVLELAHELDAVGRSNALDFLERDFAGMGVMYTAVLHQPDVLNDPRNWHIHILVYSRRCQWIETLGRWDIELTASERATHGITIANKPRRRRGNGLTPDAAFVMALRNRVAAAINVELERVRATRRIDPRSYAAMGIARTPQKHLGTRASALERAGVATAIGQYNQRVAWHARATEMRNVHRRVQAARAAIIARSEAFQSSLPVGAEEVGFRDQMRRYRDILLGLADDELVLAEVTLLGQIARSRAEMVEVSATRALLQIDNAGGRPADRATRQAIEARLAAARRHLAEIERAIEPWAEELAMARAQVATLARDAASIEQQILARLDRVDAGAEPVARPVSHAQPPSLDERWGALRRRIRVEHLAVWRVPEQTPAFAVERLAPEEKELIRSPAIIHDAGVYLHQVCEEQERAIERLTSAIEIHGIEAVAGAGDDAAAAETLASVGRLYDRYVNDERLILWLHDHLMARRLKAAQSAAIAAPLDHPEPVDPTSQILAERAPPTPAGALITTDPRSETERMAASRAAVETPARSDIQRRSASARAGAKFRGGEASREIEAPRSWMAPPRTPKESQDRARLIATTVRRIEASPDLPLVRMSEGAVPAPPTKDALELGRREQRSPEQERAYTLALAWHLSDEPAVANALMVNRRATLSKLEQALCHSPLTTQRGREIVVDADLLEPNLREAYQVARNDVDIVRTVERAHETRKRNEANRRSEEARKSREEAEVAASIVAERAHRLTVLLERLKVHRDPRQRALSATAAIIARAMHENEMRFRLSLAGDVSERFLYAFPTTDVAKWAVDKLRETPAGKAALRALSQIDSDLPPPVRRGAIAQPIKLWRIASATEHGRREQERDRDRRGGSRGD